MIVAGALAWGFDWHVWTVIQRSAFGDEFGSIVFPVPMYFRLLALFGLLCMLIGLPAMAFDLVRWARRKFAGADGTAR